MGQHVRLLDSAGLSAGLGLTGHWREEHKGKAEFVN